MSNKVMNAKMLVRRVVEECESEVMSAEQPEHLKIPEVCQRLRLGRTAVYGLMDRGELAYVKFGRARRIPHQSLEAYIRKATVPARV